MRIDAGYPAPRDLKKMELDTLDKIRNISVINNKFSNLANEAQQYYFKFKNKLDHSDFSFEICLEYTTPKLKSRAAGKWRFYFGVNIVSTQIEVVEGKGGTKKQVIHDIVSYSLSICSMNKAEPYLIRRYHFDYAINGASNNHPIFHFQSPGELSPTLDREGFSIDHMDPELSEPRLHYQPMTLALLLNLVFKEFYTENTNKVLDDEAWRGLIYKNEKEVLKPYFTHCADYLKTHHSASKLLTKDFNYGR